MMLTTYRNLITDSMNIYRFLVATFALLTVPFSAAAETLHTFRHGGSIRTVAYSPVNPSLVVSAGDTGIIKVWDLQRGTATTLGRHADAVNSIAFSPDGRSLVSGGDDYVFKVWDIPSQRLLLTRDHVTDRRRSQVKAVRFSPDGETVVTAGQHVKLWDTNNYAEITTLRHDAWVWAVAFSAPGGLLATGDDHGKVRVWNLQNRRILDTLDADSTAVYTLAFSPDNQILASAGYDGTLGLWEVWSWDSYGTLTTNGTIHDLSFSPDSTLITGTGYESVALWNVESGEKVATLTGQTDWMKAVAFSPEGNSLMSGGSDGIVRISDITSYQSEEPNTVRIIYFLPNDRTVQAGIWRKLDTLIKDTQRFYAEQMAANGFGRKTFTFETDENGAMLAYQVDGRFRDRYYHTDTADKIYTEITDQLDLEKHVYLIVADLSSEVINREATCGVGGGSWYENENLTRTRGGYAIIPASGQCFDGIYGNTVTAHELGHAFGLDHDFRNENYMMSYGAAPDRLSRCAARWLDASRFFNTDQTAYNSETSIHLQTPTTYAPNARSLPLQFRVTDADSIHQAQLLVPTSAADPAPGLKLQACRSLNTQNGNITFNVPALTQRSVNDIVLQVIDVHGNITRRNYTLRVDNTLRAENPADVNRDGAVDVTDLVLVASSFGKTIPANATENPDINRDGVVDVTDLLWVANLLSDAPAAPALNTGKTEARLTAADIQQWIRLAKKVTPSADREKGIAALEALLSTFGLPTETRLLANYPNPFNPETWIPYELAEPARVTVRIYAADGTLIRTLALGHQSAGLYHSRSRAAYWDGRNQYGEPVGSGVYFYALTAGDFTATRKLLIRK